MKAHGATRRPSAPTAVVGLLALSLGACAPGSPTASADRSHSPTAASMGPTGAAPATASPTSPPEAILATLEVGGNGWAMAKLGDALWIQVDPPVDAIVRVDTTTGATLAAAPEGHKVKAGAAGLWVVGGGWLGRFDPASGSEIVRLPIGGAFALDGDTVWLLDDEGLHRIDAETGEIVDLIKSDAGAECAKWKDLVVAFESAWLACSEGGRVIRIDVKTGDTTSIPTGWGAHTFAVLDDSIWVTNYEAGSVSRIDAESNEVTTVADAGHGVGITAGDGFVWAATERGIAKIDPESRSIVGTVYLGWGQYYELVWDAGVIWTSTRGSTILKVDPTKLAP